MSARPAGGTGTPAGWRRSAHRVALAVYGWLPEWVQLAVVRRMTPGYAVSAMVVLEDPRGRVLVVRTAYGRGRWSLPGGFVRRGEAPWEAAAREVTEELGAEVRPVPGPATVRIDPRRRQVEVGYRASVEDPDRIRARPPEIAEVRWVSGVDFPPLSMQAAAMLAAMGVGAMGPHGLLAGDPSTPGSAGPVRGSRPSG